MSNIRSLSLYELITKDVYESQRFKYRDELKRRLEQEQGLIDHLKAWNAEAALDNSFEYDEPPSSTGQGKLAAEILKSGWDFTTMKNPRGAKGITEAIKDGNWSEMVMSPPQLRFWRSIKSHYRSWSLEN